MNGSADSSDKILAIAKALLEPYSLRPTAAKLLQRLWAGYGTINRVSAIPSSSQSDSQPQTFVLKHVTPPTSTQDEGHLRKLISYQVEQYFYAHLAPYLPTDAAVARCIGSINESSTDGEATIALLLEDLRDRFPVSGERRGDSQETQVFAALRWLATFHGFWWTRDEAIREGPLRMAPLDEVKVSPQGTDGVWLNGGYTYLATRRNEFASLQADRESEWSASLCDPTNGTGSSIAELVALVLAPTHLGGGTSPLAAYETLIHGDVKSENLFVNTMGDAVAFFDFQYVGLGLGVCDLAKLFTCSVPMCMLTEQAPDMGEIDGLGMNEHERRLLVHYQTIIHQAAAKEYPWDELVMHWNTALVDWLRFQASWGFWGNTEWLEARVRHILRDKKWLEWLMRATARTPTTSS